jgi:uncharacterized protein YbjT (DUF2867 family)
MEKVLVAGATGTTGNIVVELLQKSQYFEPVAMVRKQEQQKEFEVKGIKTILGDLENDISHVTNQIDKVIFAAGSKGKKLKAVDQDGAKKLVDASTNDNIKKFVMLSSRGAGNPEQADDLKEYLQAKHNADQHLKSSGLNYTIVRPGTLNDKNGTDHIILTKTLHQDGEISRADVAQTLTRVLHDDVANQATFEILDGDELIAQALNKADSFKE